MLLPNLTDLTGQKQYRIIPSVYPPINFFENLVDVHEMEVLWEIECLTNERLRQEAGDIHLVAKHDRVSGVGSSVVMAAFTHLSKSTRFSDGQFGVYYAGLSRETAIRETVYHRENFLRCTEEDATEITMRLYEGKILKPFYDIRHEKFLHLHNPDHYADSQIFGRYLKDQSAWGLVYHSVRHEGGTCIAALRPPAISLPKQIAHLKYLWNGKKITEVLRAESVLEFM